MNRRALHALAGCIFFLLVSSQLSYSEVVKAEGRVNVLQGNTAIAREKAIDLALRKAVEQAVGTLVSSESLVQNYKMVSDQILTNSTGFVKRYDIVSEGMDKDGRMYRVVVSADVESKNLAQSLEGLGLLHVKKEKPKVMVMMEEKIMGVFGTTGYEEMNQAETAMIQKLQEMGFNIVDPETVRSNITRDKALRILEGDDRAAAAAGLQHGAQLSVIGKALSKNAGGKLFGTQMQSLQAVVTAKAIRTDDGKVIATGSEQAAKAHIDEVKGGALAIQEAAEKLGETLATKILDRWQKETYGSSQEITLVISNLVSYRHLAFVVDFLEKEVQGVKNLQQRTFNAGVAELGLDYAGKLRELAKFLAMKDFTGFRLEPTNFTQNRVDLKVVLEEGRPSAQKRK
jgi:hypothetical protein